MKTVQPRKHRKRLHQDPLHRRYKAFAAPLAQNLKKTLNIRAMPLRTGDTIRLMRGDRKGVEGKVTQVNRKKYRIMVEGVTKEKVDGTTILFPIHPSKVQIIQLNRTDKWRRRLLERKGSAREKVEVLKKQRDEKTVPSPSETQKKKRKRTKTEKTPNLTEEKTNGEKRRKKTSKTQTST